MYIWKLVMCTAWAALADRKSSSPPSAPPLPPGLSAADALGNGGADGMEVERQSGGIDGLPERGPARVPQRSDVGGVGDVEAAQRAPLGHPLDLGQSRVQRAVGNTGQARITIGMRL